MITRHSSSSHRNTTDYGKIGVLCECYVPTEQSPELDIWIVQLVDGRSLRYLGKDLKKIS